MALTEARYLIEQAQKLFSLYDPTSSISKLNRTGVLMLPDIRFLDLMQAAGTAHDLTDGLFDPTVQPLWQAIATGDDPQTAIDATGWRKVQHGPDKITLGHSQALTFNGIAQGFATDLIADALAARGLTNTLVNIGEYRGTGGPWSLALADPTFGVLGNRKLSQGAIATSSPTATQLGASGHIVHPNAQPHWSTVSVEASTATLADSLSTAMVLAPRNQIEAIKARTDIKRVTLVDFEGDLITL
jgi:thiamine biosynthesis lipoprotein